MMRETLTWLALGGAGLGAGWTWHWRRSVEPSEVSVRAHYCELHAAEHEHGAEHSVSSGPRVELSDPAPETDPRLIEISRRAIAYVPGAADEYELEAFWRDCSPVPVEDLEPLFEELEERLASFEEMAQQRGGEVLEQPALEGAWSTDDFLTEYTRVGLAESLFLLTECLEGRLRLAPFIPIPMTVHEAGHPTVQLVPHHSKSGFTGYVARLEKGLEPELFEDRPRLYALARELAAARDAAAEEPAAITGDF